MATASTLALILVLSLVLGWRYHFRVMEHRRMITQMGQKAEQARLTQAHTPLSTEVGTASSPGVAQTVLTVGTETLLHYNPNAPKVPKATSEELLPMVNAGSLVTEAEQIINKYTSTPNWQDRLQYVFEPERVRRLMEDYYDVQNDIDPVRGALMNYGRIRMNGWEILQMNFRGARESGRLGLLLRRTRTNRLVIDWESFVGYSEKGFRELIRTRPTTPVLVRGFVRLDSYYNYEFGDDKKHLSLKVTSPDGTEFINAFCPRDGEIATWLFNDLGGRPQDSPSSKPYTLWINYPEKAQSEHCTHLIQIQADRWIVLPEK